MKELTKPIIIGALIIAVAILASQYMKQQSIEQQQQIKINELAKEREADIFGKKEKCAKYASEIKKEVDEHNSSTIFGSWFSQYFEMIFYSPKEDSCLYVITRTTPSDEDGEKEFFIHNALTKSRITSFQFPTQFEEYKKFILDYSGGEIRL